MRVRVYLFKVQDILYIGAAEFINGLVVVADHAQIPVDAAVFVCVGGKQ